MKCVKGQHPSLETKYKKGAHYTPQTEFKKGLVPWHKGKISVYSQEALEKMRLAKLGKKLSEEHKRKMSEARKGHIVSDETRNKISNSLLGEKHWNWMGGCSKKQYPLGWNRTFREQIRKRDNYKCGICGTSETDCIYKLSVHHIDYDKKNLSLDNLISLCRNCHSKTNNKREKWIRYFRERYVTLGI